MTKHVLSGSSSKACKTSNFIYPLVNPLVPEAEAEVEEKVTPFMVVAVTHQQEEASK